MIVYHWHPYGRSSIRRPHLHVRADLQIGERSLGKVHLPTGFVAIEDIMTLAISEPLREDWQALIADRAPTMTAERARHRQLVIELRADADQRVRRSAWTEPEDDGQPSVLECDVLGARGDGSASQPAGEAHANRGRFDVSGTRVRQLLHFGLDGVPLAAIRRRSTKPRPSTLAEYRRGTYCGGHEPPL